MIKNLAILLLVLSLTSHLLVIKCEDELEYNIDEDLEDSEEAEVPGLKPNPSLNTDFPLNVLQTFNSSVYISQFVSFILTGSYNGGAPLDNSTDNLNLDELLDIGLLVLQSVIAEDPPEDLNGIFPPFKLQFLYLTFNEFK